MGAGLKGWHPGELQIQRSLGYDKAVAQWYRGITPGMPEEHRQFHSTRLPFLPVTTLDGQGRPWGSLFAHHGERGFIRSPSPTSLIMEISPPIGDPFIENSKLLESSGDMLIAGIGIEFSTRRRNKFAGRVKSLTKKDESYRLVLDVNEAIG